MQKYEISIKDWWEEAKNNNCRTLSRYSRPLYDGSAFLIVCTLREFIKTDPFLVRFSDSAGRLRNNDGRPIQWFDPGAQPLTAEQYIALGGYPIDETVWQDDPRFINKYFSLTCSGCQRRIIIDGTHRILKLVKDDELDMPILVYDLVGEEWPPQTPDMSAVCMCNKAQNECAIQ